MTWSAVSFTGWIQDDRRRVGFTLLELMVVLALVGLIATTVVPRLSGSYEKLPLRTAARDLAAIMRFAHSQAISRSRSIAVIFQSESRRILVAIPKEDDDHYDDASETNEEAMQRMYFLPEGLSLAFQSEKKETENQDFTIVTFFPIGNSTGADILLSDALGGSKRIEVDFITGVVSMRE